MSAPHNVMVVDDDGDLRTALVASLEAEGHVVVEAEHGRHALEKLSVAAPHLIILDLTMPVMDGRAFLEEKAKGEHAAIPVIVFSSLPPSEIDAMPGVVAVVHKLSGVEALLSAIKSAAAGLARAIAGPPADPPAFLKLQNQLLRLGLLTPSRPAICSSCLLALPLFSEVKPLLCLRCLAQQRGFAFTAEA